MNLDECFHLIFQHSSEELLQLAASEVLKHGLPVWGAFEFSEVRTHVASQNSEGGRFSDTVLTDKTKNLTRAGRRQSVELEGIGSVSVSGLTGQTFGQVNNADSVEGTPLDTLTTTDTERLGNEADGGGWHNLNAELADLVDGALLAALLLALLWLALIRVDNRNSNFVV